MSEVDSNRFVIKICGITTVSDAEDAVVSGATALGFNFYPKSSRYVSVGLAHEIAQPLPRHVVRVGVFVNATVEELTATLGAVPLDVLQLHGAIPQALPNARVWRAMQVNKHFSSTDLTDSYEAYLFDTPSSTFGGSGETFDWTLAGIPSRSTRVIVAGGLDAGNVAEAIKTMHPWGVDACSRLEFRPGRKDPAKVKAFVEAARSAFEQLSHQTGSPKASTEN